MCCFIFDSRQRQCNRPRQLTNCSYVFFFLCLFTHGTSRFLTFLLGSYVGAAYFWSRISITSCVRDRVVFAGGKKKERYSRLCGSARKLRSSVCETLDVAYVDGLFSNSIEVLATACTRETITAKKNRESIF